MKLVLIESKWWKFSKVGPITISFHMLNHEPLKGSKEGGGGWGGWMANHAPMEHKALPRLL